ncbi:MAG TPA: hypothetical protein VK507_09005 [Iamia sp.]|nr:hypothetical protein [Iamia sp.]
MRSTPTIRRRRRITVATAGLVLATIASSFGAAPAGAVNAPLTTTDGLGVRVDENAILGPALEAIETALQPTVNTMVYNGAVSGSPVGSPNSITITNNLELSIDFLAPAAGRPDGGLSVHASIQDINIRYQKKAWWHSMCSIWVDPYDASIDATANIDRARLPNAPLTLLPITADWDDDPSISTSGVCWTYLIDDFFDGFFGSGDEEGSIADNIEDQLNGTAQGLIDDLWTDHVVPVLSTLNEFGITFNQVRTDTNGLVVTANVNASAGITVPGFPGPKNVTNTEDAGVTSDVNTLLAARREVTVSIHPNVVNQFMNALNQSLNGNFAAPPVPGASVEAYLLPPASRGLYDDNSWSVTHSVGTPYFTKPTGAGGRPQVQMPQSNFAFFNADYVFGLVPVAVFNGTLGGLDLLTEIRPGTSNFGPYVSSTNAAVSSMTFDALSSDPDVVTWNPNPTGVLPYAKASVDQFSDVFLTDFVSLAPISIGGISVSLCTACTRVSGDQRYTEFFNVG